MSVAQILTLASHNPGKLRELQALLGDAVQLNALADYTAVAPEENGRSFVENALIKARHAAILSGGAALADDSGLVVDALNDEPGIHSARFAPEGGDTANNCLLLKRLSGVPEAQRTARFVCVLALVRHADDPLPIICEGIWEGRILTEVRGMSGFGYDPVFWVDELGCSSAELAPEVKNAHSHRGRAIALLRQRLGI